MWRCLVSVLILATTVHAVLGCCGHHAHEAGAAAHCIDGQVHIHESLCLCDKTDRLCDETGAAGKQKPHQQAGYADCLTSICNQGTYLVAAVKAPGDGPHHRQACDQGQCQSVIAQRIQAPDSRNVSALGAGGASSPRDRFKDVQGSDYEAAFFAHAPQAPWPSLHMQCSLLLI